MATKYGALKNSYWKAFLVYVASSDETSYTITVHGAGPYASDGWVNYKFEMDLSATGKTTRSYGPWQARIDKGGRHDFITDTVAFKFTKGTSSSTKTVKAKVTNVNTGSISTVTLNVTVPALKKYTVTYNANGGSGAPGSQSKYYGKTLTLSSTKPTRTGYTFKGWATSASGSRAYSAGGNYTSNASVTLYAVWEAKTYTITLDANGGSGGTSVSKTYGQSVTLPSAVPTKTNYNFKGWANTPTAQSADYVAGASYSETITADTTLYAVWELAYIPPQISGLVAMRTDSSGSTLDDTGTYAKIRFDWKAGTNGSTSLVPESIKVEMRESGTSGYTEIYESTPTDETSGSATSGLISNVSTETQYDVRVTVADAVGSVVRNTYISKANFLIDVNRDGTGMAFGEPAADGVERLVVNLDTVFKKSVNIEGSISIGDKNYVHSQETAAAEWEVTHNLGKNPAVTVIDSANTEVIGEVEHVNSNKCILRFQAAFAGKAIFN